MLTTEQYLNNPIDSVIDHLNKSSLQSEMPFVSAVLSARATISFEKLTKKIISLTCILAITSIIMAFVSVCALFSNFQTNKTFQQQQKEINALNVQIEQLKKENLETIIIYKKLIIQQNALQDSFKEVIDKKTK